MATSRRLGCAPQSGSGFDGVKFLFRVTLKHGKYSAESIAERRFLRELMRASQGLIEAI
jgi:hypothetical protein